MIFSLIYSNLFQTPTLFLIEYSSSRQLYTWLVEIIAGKY